MADDVELDLSKMKRLMRDYPTEAHSWLKGVGVHMVGDVQQGMLDSPAIGETYSRGKGRVHTASVEGNPPRPDMSSLIQSIKLREMGHLHFRIEDGVKYGIMLEEGTERMGPRPFMQPVFDAWRVKIVNDAIDNLGIAF